MSRVFVHGIGAVSPAGWGAGKLREALLAGVPLPIQFSRGSRDRQLPVRLAPAPPAPPAFLSHPRLRRSGALTQHVVAAALEAIGRDVEAVQQGKIRLAIVVCVMAGNVNYTRRFFEEVLKDPAVASPLIFPETVFNAPASHLAAFLKVTGTCHTFVGDDGMFLQAAAFGAGSLVRDEADACVIVGGEESDWVGAEALHYFHKRSVHAAGAGALYLKKGATGALAELAGVTDAFGLSSRQNRTQIARRMRASLAEENGGSGETVFLGLQDIPRLDRAEEEAWKDWRGERRYVKRILGEAFAAAAAWQCAAACDEIAAGRSTGALVSVVGANQQAIGARFAAPPAPDSRP